MKTPEKLSDSTGRGNYRIWGILCFLILLGTILIQTGWWGPRVLSTDPPSSATSIPARDSSPAALTTGVTTDVTAALTEIPPDTPLHKITAPKVLPEMAKLPMIEASLAVLKEKGADFSKPMPSKHQILCETLEIANLVAAWGAGRGFTAAEPTKFHTHGEIEQFLLFLTKTAPPVATEIQAQAEDVFAGVAPVSGALYFTWMGAVVR